MISAMRLSVLRNPYPLAMVTLILLLMLSTRPLPVPRFTAAITSARLRLTFFSTATTGAILQYAVAFSQASSSPCVSCASFARKTAL